MRYEILYILRSRISKICFMLLLLVNAWSVITSSKDETVSSSVEANIVSFENDMENTQSILSQLQLSYSAQEQFMDETEKNDWKNFERYLDWKIENSKSGWKLFNSKGEKVLTNDNLMNQYRSIVIWDLAFQMDCFSDIKKHQDVSEKVFKDEFKEAGFVQPKVDFESDRLYRIQSLLVEDDDGYYEHYKSLLEDNLYRKTSDAKQIYGGEGPWGFLVDQLRKNSIFGLIVGPLCLFYTIMVLSNLQRDRALQLVEIQPRSKERLVLYQLINIEVSFLLILGASLLIPFLWLGIQSGFEGLQTRLLMYTKGLHGFKLSEHGTNYVTNLVSEYYATDNGIMSVGLNYYKISAALIYAFLLGFIKLTFYTLLGVAIFFLTNKVWKKYIFSAICVFVYCISNIVHGGFLSNINPFDVQACLSVASGTGNQTWMYSMCLLIVWILLLLALCKMIKKKDLYL